MKGPQAHMLDARRLHLNHGPIDLIVEVWGRDWQKALVQAEARFQDILQTLVDEIDLLRKPLDIFPTGPVARRMAAAVQPFPVFVTPMAAVAGAVADEVLAAMIANLNLERAYVNNGGDIACFLTPGQMLEAAIPGFGQVALQSDEPGRGLATSGWRGRSQSFGIADAVTVVAKDAAAADVAATLIANAVDLPGHPMVGRTPASDLLPDSDLGSRMVTVSVGNLSMGEVGQALEKGRVMAREMLASGHIHAAALLLQDQKIVAGDFSDDQQRKQRNARLQTA